MKDVKRVHEKPELKYALRDLRYVMERVHGRLEFSGPLRIIDGGYVLDGDLYFAPRSTP